MLGHLFVEGDITEQCRNTNILKKERTVSVTYSQNLWYLMIVEKVLLIGSLRSELYYFRSRESFRRKICCNTNRHVILASFHFLGFYKNIDFTFGPNNYAYH